MTILVFGDLWSSQEVRARALLTGEKEDTEKWGQLSYLTLLRVKTIVIPDTVV